MRRSANFNGTLTDAFTFKAWDQSSGSGSVGDKVDTSTSSAFSTNTDTAQITITAVNDAPTLTGIPASFTVTEDVAGNLLFTGTPFADLDSTALTVILAIEDGSITAATGGGVTVTGTATSRNFAGTAAALNTFFTTAGNITYTTAQNNTAQRNLTVQISDGILSTSTTATVNVTPVNDAPTLTSIPTSFTVTEDVAGNLLFTGSPFADVDSTTLTVTLSIADGTITAASGGGVTVDGSATQRTFQGTAADLNTFFTTAGNITYTTAQNNTAARSLTVQISDGSLSASTTAMVNVTPVNDPPTASLTSVSSTGLTLLASDPDAGATLSLYNWTNGSAASLNNGASTTVAVNRNLTFGAINGTGLIVSDGVAQVNVQVGGKDVYVIWGSNGVDAPDLADFGGYSYLLYGYNGNDLLTGDVNSDFIAAGVGTDVMTGGDGSDTFVFSAGDSNLNTTISTANFISGTVFDTITDFAKGSGGDKLDLAGTPSLPSSPTDLDVSAATVEIDEITGSITNGIIALGGADQANVDTLAEWLSVARSVVTTTGQVGAFEFDGDTYVFQELGANTSLLTSDLLIKLTGVTGVTDLSTTTLGANSVWIS